MASIADCVVLYVEDDDSAAFLFQIALSELEKRPQLFRVTNGDQAMAFLSRTRPYRDAPRPNLVLLDLNLPGKSGFDVLAEMKTNPQLRDIPVFVFSGSTLPYDRERSSQIGADDYLPKGTEYETFVRAVQAVCEKLDS
jgi:two-component system, chemotaxis family, response regulator Rcp1